MHQTPQLTIRSEQEKQMVAALYNALMWRVRVQLQAMPTLTAQQFHEMVGVAVSDTHVIAGEIANLFPAIEALMRVGWRPMDAFDRSLPPPPGAHSAQPHAPSAGQAGQQGQPGAELNQFGRELDKGFRELGGAIDGLLTGKKK